MEGLPLLNQMLPDQRETMLRFVTTSTFSKTDKIIKQGDEGNIFYIIMNGECVVERAVPGTDRTREVARLGPGDFFGENALLTDTPRDSSVIATDTCTCMLIERNTFVKYLGPMDEITKKHKQRRGETNRRASMAKFEIQDLPKWEDLKLGKTLGAGSFGRVRVAFWKDKVFANKALRKQAIVDMQQTEHIRNEKQCLHDMNHPFILQLVNTYKDPTYLYMLLEMVQGGELFSFLADRGFLSESHARFYVAQVVLAFGAMQAKGYVYRDLKPENLMLDKEGYIKIVDFGFAKIVETSTKTLCGTPDYLAPEIVGCRGHNHAVDWWATGILIYELINGTPPFASNNPMYTYKMIANWDGETMRFPSHFSAEVKDLILKLLKPNPSLRLGCLKGGAQDVQDHKWFDGIDWAAMMAKKLPAPWKPTIKDDKDLSRFTDEYPDSDTEDVPYTGDESWFADF
jgi:cGMP-dependent protein kinase